MMQTYSAGAALIATSLALSHPIQSLAAGAGTVQSLASGKCLDLEGGSTFDGPVVIQ